jgi:hypothetical protein
MQTTVILDIGGTCFRVSKSTLSIVDNSYFARLVSDQWSEFQGGLGNDDNVGGSTFLSGSSNHIHQQREERTLFIDRDPECFPSILSYLRSLKVYFTEDITNLYLERLLDEADYYLLDGLHSLVKNELERREIEKISRDEADKKDSTAAGDVVEVFKCISPTELNSFFDCGYVYVSSFQGNDTASCSANANACKIEASWRDGKCTACGERMIYDRFIKHMTYLRPTRIVVKRVKTNNKNKNNNSKSTQGGSGNSVNNIHNSGSSIGSIINDHSSSIIGSTHMTLRHRSINVSSNIVTQQIDAAENTLQAVGASGAIGDAGGVTTTTLLTQMSGTNGNESMTPSQFNLDQSY